MQQKGVIRKKVLIWKGGGMKKLLSVSLAHRLPVGSSVAVTSGRGRRVWEGSLSRNMPLSRREMPRMRIIQIVRVCRKSLPGSPCHALPLEPPSESPFGHGLGSITATVACLVLPDGCFHGLAAVTDPHFANQLARSVHRPQATGPSDRLPRAEAPVDGSLTSLAAVDENAEEVLSGLTACCCLLHRHRHCVQKKKEKAGNHCRALQREGGIMSAWAFSYPPIMILLVGRGFGQSSSSCMYAVCNE
ncbi:hypothetical protein B0H63DRAFT_29068 [Podospora didyma]|uniref:Uncharacterized protein n=1 Tax=Podospora didyma TaxID=330526 RepID=A0AAE0U7G1_9PEZI|nr:hypothetical protein B0H63DRAFT_29068 [Podospora didyma]